MSYSDLVNEHRQRKYIQKLAVRLERARSMMAFLRKQMPLWRSDLRWRQSLLVPERAVRRSPRLKKEAKVIDLTQ